MSFPLVVCTIGRVQSVAVAVPLLPDEIDASRTALASCRDGERKEAYADSRRRAGIIREAVWIQAAPAGHVAVVYLEADDLTTALTILSTSVEPFDRWFRDSLRQVHGPALAQASSFPEPMLDFDANRV